MSPHTVRNYLSDLRQFLEIAAEANGEGAALLSHPDQIDAGMIRTYLKVLYQRGVEARTLGRKLASMRSFLQFMERRGHVSSNVARAVRTPKAQRPLPNTLPIDHVFALLDTPQEPDPEKTVPWMRQRDQAILELFYASGVRVSELAALDVQSLDLVAGAMRVLGKGNRERQVFFGKTAAQALRDYLEAREISGLGQSEPALFLNRHGHRPQHARRAVAHQKALPPHRRLHAHQPAHFAARLRHASAGQRRRPAQHPGTAGAPAAFHHPEIHPCQRRPYARRVRPGASARSAVTGEHMIRSTTILCVRHNSQVAMAGDGQVSFNTTVMKHHARKIRKVHRDQVLTGFAGAAADAFTLVDRFETKLEEYQGSLIRAAVELAKDWRADRVLRRLEALLAVADRQTSLILSGTGDIIEPDDGIVGIGSGGSYALAAARALQQHTQLSAREIAETAMRIAADICIYTNDHISVEEL